MMLKFCTGLLLILISGLSAPMSAQPYWESIDLYTTRNGLPNNSILSIHQDSKGFLWIGTYNGLCRYDGNVFKNFKNEWHGQDRGWLYSVKVIREDQDSNIWVGTLGGIVAKMDKSGDWTWVQLEAGVITDILVDKDRTVWVTTNTGKLGKLENNKFIQMQSLHGLSRIYPFSESELLLVASEYYAFSRSTGALRQIELQIPPDMKGMLNTGGQVFTFRTGGEVTGYDLQSRESYRVGALPAMDLNVFNNPAAESTDGGLLILDRNHIVEISKKGISRLSLEEGSRQFNGSRYNVIFEDRSGLIWIGTNYGLFKVDRKKIAFKKFTSNNQIRKLKHEYVRAIHVRENEVWVGTKQGEVGKLVIDTITKEPLYQHWYGATSGNHLLNSLTVNAINHDSRGNIWIGGLEGLFVLRKGKNRFEFAECHSQYGKLVPIKEIWTITPDGNGNLLIGTIHSGMFAVDPETYEVRPVSYNGKQIEFPVWNIYTSARGTIWVGTGNGLYTARQIDGLYALETPPGKLPGLRDVWSLTEDRNGKLWIGTTSNGIYMLDPGKSLVRNYNKSRGLADNIVSAVIADAYDNIWVATVNGLSKFHISTKRITNFDEGDGLINNDFNFKACAYAPWGEIYMGTKVGITAYDPATVSVNHVSDAPVEITEIWVKGVQYHGGKKRLTLSNASNNINFRFAVLDYSKPASHRYRYKLEGFDKQWQAAAYDNPTAVYTNLPAGSYRFIVEASPDGRVWSSRRAVTEFVIEPVIWRQPIFWVVFGGAFFLASGLYVRGRVRSVIRQEKEKTYINKHLAELEMKALNAQMNPHFIFNAIGAIQHYIVKNDVVSANEYLSKFARLMRLILRSSRNKFILLNDEVSLLELYISLEQLRFEGRFDFSISIDEDLLINEAEIPSMLIQPFVENAINHGLLNKEGKGRLDLSFAFDAGRTAMRCIIEDDGIGRAKANQLRMQNKPGHMSAGMSLVAERVKTFNDVESTGIQIRVEDKYAENQEPAGTLVEITVPFTPKWK